MSYLLITCQTSRTSKNKVTRIVPLKRNWLYAHILITKWVSYASEIKKIGQVIFGCPRTSEIIADVIMPEKSYVIPFKL